MEMSSGCIIGNQNREKIEHNREELFALEKKVGITTEKFNIMTERFEEKFDDMKENINNLQGRLDNVTEDLLEVRENISKMGNNIDRLEENLTEKIDNLSSQFNLHFEKLSADLSSQLQEEINKTVQASDKKTSEAIGQFNMKLDAYHKRMDEYKEDTQEIGDKIRDFEENFPKKVDKYIADSKKTRLYNVVKWIIVGLGAPTLVYVVSRFLGKVVGI